MTWEILWALVLGFTLSAVVQAVIRRSTIIKRLGDDRPRTLALAAGLGAASSVLLLRRGGPRPRPLQKGGQLHRSYGFRDRLDQSGSRAGRHLGRADWLAVHLGRVRRRPDHDRAHRTDLPAIPAPEAPRRGPGTGRQRPSWIDGGSRRHGHDDYRGWEPVATAAVEARARPRSRTSSSWSGPRSSGTSPAAC